MVHGPVLAGASTGQVPLVQSCFSRALSIIVDGSEQPFLTGISRARDELAMSLPRITNLLKSCSVTTKSAAATVMWPPQCSRTWHSTATCTQAWTTLLSLTQPSVDQELLGQASTSSSLPVPYKADPQVATQVPPVDQRHFLES